MSDDTKKLEQLEARFLEFRIGKLEEQQRRYDSLNEKVADALTRLTGRVVQLEANEENYAAQLKQLNESNKVQNKLLVAIVTASAGTLITLILKALTITA
jgi:hypothetical protein